MAMGFFVRSGARDETAAVSGVSHFLEHMMFKGTDRHSALEVNLEFDQMGAKYNAFTSEENTVYYAAVLPEYQQRILALWAELMRPALRDDDFNTEKGVICEEIAMYKDMPHFEVMDRCRKLHFGEHGCGNSVLGTVESIMGMSSGQMRAYFNQRYSPDNMVLACSGKVEWEAFVEQARQLCGGWKAFSPRRGLGDNRGSGQREIVPQEKIVREHICLMNAAPSSQDPMRFAASVLANIIGDDSGSRLYWALIDTALADSADMDCDSMDGTGAYFTYISCDPAKAEQVTGIVQECFRKVQAEGVTEAELEASKNKIAAALTLNGELPMGRLVPLGFNWIYRQEYRSQAEDLATVQAISREDIRKLLAEYPLDRMTVLGFGPCEKI